MYRDYWIGVYITIIIMFTTIMLYYYIHPLAMIVLTMISFRLGELLTHYLDKKYGTDKKQ